MRVPRGLLALAAAAILGLGGCAVIPSRGAVHAGPTDQPDQPGLVFIPEGPNGGDTPDEIVRGFVQAASQGKGYAVAKEFLTPAFAKRWDPSARVLVHDASWTTRATSRPTTTSASIRMSVPVSAGVDGTGWYTPAARSQAVPFQLTRVNGQWRIGSTPDGIVLTQDVFQRTFVPAVLQFWDPSFARLVPDLRWFPASGSAVRTVVRALLAGAAAPLRGQVTGTAFPADTRIVSASGSTSAGTATVALDAPGGGPSAAVLGRMWEQLSSSLQLAPADVTLTVNGRIASGTPPRPAAIQPSNLPVVFAGGRFGVLRPSGLVPNAVLGARVAALDPRAVTVSTEQGFAAVLNRSGVSVVTRGAVRTVDRRPGLIDPSVDQRGWTYSVPKGDPSGLTAYSADRSVSLQEVLPGTAVQSIEVSPDGTRMLVLTESATGAPQAFVAGIERAADGTPTGLTSSRYPVDMTADSALDVTWVDDASVAALTLQQDQQDVTITVLGGVSQTLGRIADATDLVGATLKGDLRARLNTGDIDVWRNSSWQPEFPSTVNVKVLAVQR